MASEPVSLNTYLEKLREDLERICAQEGLEASTAEHAGYAFARYVASLFMDHDFGLEDELDSVVLRGGKDLGVDIVLQNDISRTIVLIQTKYRGTSANKPKDIEPEAVHAFLHRHADLLDPARVSDGSELAKELLSSYRERVDHEWKARFYFVTTAKIGDELRAACERHNRQTGASPHDVEFALLDRSDLREMSNQVSARELSIPELVEIDLPADTFFEKETPRPCVIAILKGNSLRNEYNKKGRKESLFAWNIRNYLGDRGINRAIKETAAKAPNDFFYFNNGVTAVCKDYELTDNHLTIRKFQIINGAQTVASLAKAPIDANVEVLFRLIKTGKVDTESGINREIIRCNNTQNAIKLSDFRANDPIQRWLETRINDRGATPILGKLTYQPKRTGRRGSGRVLNLEELGKIRYAFLVDPLLVHSAPKDLWTPQSDGGAYETAFGTEGNILPEWSNALLDQTLLAIALHDRIAAACKAERAKDDTQAYFSRLRFHGLALFGDQLRVSPAASPHTLLSNQARFDECWGRLWRPVRQTLYSTYGRFVRDVEKNPMTMFAFVRSERAWDSMRNELRFNLSA